MHEIGGWIEPNATATDCERRSTEVRQWDVSEPQVDGLPFHVQAPGGDAFAVLPEHLVRRRRAVAGDDLERRRSRGLRRQMMQQIEQVGIDRVHVPGSEVAQKVANEAPILNYCLYRSTTEAGRILA